jgi:YtkA-like protein
VSTRVLVAAALAFATFIAPAAAGPSVSVKVTSRKGLFSAEVTRPNPLPVEQLHTWRLRLFNKAHHPVTRARIKVTGDMPAHGHGLPTEPVAVSRGRGRYELQGMMFQMPGRWYVQLQIHAAGRLDTIRIRFTIAE